MMMILYMFRILILLSFEDHLYVLVRAMDSYLFATAYVGYHEYKVVLTYYH